MSGGLARLVRKEVRVLGAGWIACLVALAMMGILEQAPATLVLVTYVVGPVALGALSVGHEYNHRTLAHLLAQPVSRVRILSVKVAVLGILLAALWAAAGWSASSAGRLDPGPISGYVWATWVFPILAGFCLAPWLTMLCRSALAGLVFAMATPAAIWIGAVLVTVARFGGEAANTPEAEASRLALLWAGMLAASLAGVVLTWRGFIGLEAIDGRGEDVALPAWLRRPAASVAPRRRPAMWHLALKELRLQQMTFVVSVLFAACWLLWPLLSEALPAAAPAGSLQALTFAHGGFVSLLAGSLASAEERQYGTREWHLLLPMASATQWAAKAATAIGVALVLALGVPGVLNAIAAAGPWPARPGNDLAAAAMGVSILAAGSLYISSLSTSGVRAVIAAVIALPIAVPLANALMSLSMQAIWTVAAMTGASRPVPGPGRWVGWLNGAILVVLLLRSGLVNHRAHAVAWPRVVRQVLSIGSWIVIATVVAALAG